MLVSLLLLLILLPVRIINLRGSSSQPVFVFFVLIIFGYFFPRIIKTDIGNIIITENIMWRYKYNHHDKSLSIGCINMSLPEWSHFFSKECTDEYETPRNTFRFWLLRQRYKQMIKLIKHGQL